MKKLFGILLMIGVIAGGSVTNAQSPISGIANGTEQLAKANESEKKDKKDLKDKKDKKDLKDKKTKKDLRDKKTNKDRKGFEGSKEVNSRHQGKAQHPDLFEGITLTQEQRKQLEALKAEQKAQKGQEKGEKDKMNKEDRQAQRAEFTAKVKEILTPEQWNVYQQNVDKMKANRPKKNRR